MGAATWFSDVSSHTVCISYISDVSLSALCWCNFRRGSKLYRCHKIYRPFYFGCFKLSTCFSHVLSEVTGAYDVLAIRFGASRTKRLKTNTWWARGTKKIPRGVGFYFFRRLFVVFFSVTSSWKVGLSFDVDLQRIFGQDDGKVLWNIEVSASRFINLWMGVCMIKM